MSQRNDCIERVHSAVDQAVDYIKDWERTTDLWDKGADRQVFACTAGNSEMSTRYILIDPILRALGWDLSDPQQCVVDYNLPSGMRPDYFLFGRDGLLIAIIEAKRIDEHTDNTEHWYQIDDYAEFQKPRLACVTNGEYWRFCLYENGVILPQKALSLTWYDRDETANRLCGFLGRSV